MSDIVRINKKEISSFVEEAGKFVFKKEAEEQLLLLLDAIDYLNNALKEVKANIAKAGATLTPDFKGVIGKKLNVTASYSGDRYKVDNQEFLKEISYKRSDPAKIDQFVEREKKLPDGVQLVEREKKIEISRKKNEITPTS